MRFKHEFRIIGGGLLPVETDDAPIVLDGIEMEEREFIIKNPTAREISFLSVTVKVEGPAKDKIKVSLLSDVLTIPANGQITNKLIVEAQEALLDTDEATATISAQEEGTVTS